MNTVPPGVWPGQTVQSPQISIRTEPDFRERWERMIASDAKIVAYMVANHVYGSLRGRSFHDRLAASWMVVNDHNLRTFALDFIDWDLGDLTRDFEPSSFTSSFDVLARGVDDVVDTVSRSVPGVRRRFLEAVVLPHDRKTIWCALAATRCRRELGDSTAVMRAHHARARAGRAALQAGDRGDPQYAQAIEQIEIVEESSRVAHVGIMRAMRYIQQRTEQSYNEGVPVILRLLDESDAVDWSDLCSAQLADAATRLGSLLDAAPDMRDELLALGLDPQTHALVSACAPGRPPAGGIPSTTLKMRAFKKTARSRAR